MSPMDKNPKTDAAAPSSPRKGQSAQAQQEKEARQKEKQAILAELQGELDDESYAELLVKLEKGHSTPAELAGLEDGHLDILENIGLGYYRAGYLEEGASVLQYLLGMEYRRPTAWRALGACYHAGKNYPMAVVAYHTASSLNPEDWASIVYAGECLLLSGDKIGGLTTLKALLEAAQIPDEGPNAGLDPVPGAYKPYLVRAQVLVAARGILPPTVVVKNHSEKDTTKAPESKTQAADASDGAYQAFVAGDPKRAQMLEELCAAVGEGKIDLAELGGFGPEEIDGGYAFACHCVETDKTEEAMTLITTLSLLSPKDHRFSRLMGIALQRMEEYAGAEMQYELSDELKADDPMTLVYWGEAKTMLGEIDEGLALIRKGRDLADAAQKGASREDAAAMRALCERAELLLGRFAD